jgi:hypothetical protein
MQPALMMKQTLEASYDPGVFLLDGPNVRLTSARQAVTKGKNRFSIAFHGPADSKYQIAYRLAKNGFEILEMTIGHRTFQPDMNDNHVKLVRSRCFLTLRIDAAFGIDDVEIAQFTQQSSLERWLRGLIHIPGLRGNPERTYRTTGVGDSFPGAFENYVASVIAHWQASGAEDSLSGVAADLNHLQLTSKIQAKQLDDTRVELLVGRTRRKTDLVSIADVDLGVSQVLPVIVALRVAKPGQPVYVEQPEIHLHPSAQWRLARILADAARRGVRVIVETHSSLLLRGVQTLVATGYLPTTDVALNWFSRDESTGFSRVTTANLDGNGAFGDWPADFDQINLEAEAKYLDAVGQRNLH